MTPTISRIPLRTVIVSLSIHTVVAADGVWTNPAGGSWAEAANWSGGTIADGAGAAADFGTLGLAANAAVTLDGDRSVGSLQFADTAGSYDWALDTGSGGVLTLSSGAVPSVSVGNRTAAIGAAIGGTQGFRKTGAGSLVLSGANTFAGTLQVEEGTVRAGNAGALGATGAGNETVVAGGGIFDLNGRALADTEIFRISGNGADGGGAFVNLGADQQNGVNRIVLDGDATVGGTGRFDLRAGTLPTLDLAGHTLTKVGTNQVGLVGRDLITDPAEPADTITAVLTAGSLVINEGVFAIENTASADASGTITINSGGTLGLWANKQGRLARPVVSNNGTIRNLGSNADISSPVSLSSGSTLTLSGSASTVMRGVVSGTGDLVKTGTGNFSFPNANTFTGKTSVTGGTLGMFAEGALGTAPAAFQADHLTLDGGTISSIAAGGYYANGGPAFGANRGVVLGAAGGTFDVYGHANSRSRIIVSGIISGEGQLRKSGGGYLNLNAANTYAGGTAVSDGPALSDTIPYGAIQITSYGAFGSGPVNFTNTGAIHGLRFSATGTLPNEIVLGDSATAATGIIVDAGKIATLAAPVSGGNFSGGELHLTGGGFLVMEGEKTYASATKVNGGTLVVNGTLVDSDVTVNAGGAIGGSGNVRQLFLEEGSAIVASSPALSSFFGVTASKADGGKGVEVLVTDSPATPGTRTVDVVGYGSDEEGLAPELANFNTSSYRSAVFADDTVNNKITLTYTNSTRTWNTTDGTWDIAATESWAEDDLKFYQGDAVTFGNPAAASTVTLAGLLAPSSVTVDNTNNYLFTGSGSIAGGSLVKDGTGMLVLAGGNSYAGGTVINGGTLSLSSTAAAAGGNAGALGTGPVTVNTGGILKLWVSTGATTVYPNAITLDGGKLLGEDGVNVIAGPVTLGAGGGTASAKWNNKNLVFANIVSGSGKLTVARETPSGESNAAVYLTRANAYTGGTDLFSGQIRVEDDAALGTGTLAFTGSATLATSITGGERVIGNAVSIAGGATASLDGGYFPLTLNGTISGEGVLALASNGVVAIGGENTYTGGTLFGSTGRLRVDSPGALGTTGTLTFTGGTLMHGAGNTVDYSARFSTADNQRYSVDTNGQTVVWASPLASTGGTLWKYGEGTLVLTGAGTYSGGSNFQGGVVETALISDSGATPLGTFSTAGASYMSFGGGTLRYTGPGASTARHLWNDQVSGTIEVSDPAATLAFTATGGGRNKPFTKTGPGTLTLAGAITGEATVTVAGGTLNLNGANTYTGTSSVTAGTLAMGTDSLPDAGDVSLAAEGAALHLGFTGTDNVGRLLIGGEEMAAGTWGGTASAATHKTPLITGTGILNVLSGPGGGGSAYDDWASLNGLDAGNNGKSMDPDHDGLDNLGEFAFDGAALSGAATGKIVTKVATIGGKDYLTLTIPVRGGASFGTDMVSTPADGVVYEIQGTLDLSGFTLEVVEITGPDAEAIQQDLPELSSEGWTYRSFRPAEDMSAADKQFLRAVAEEE